MGHDEEIPGGRFGRFAKLARAGARVGAGALLKRDSDAAVRKAAEALGTLRGVAAKVGQMAAYVDGLVPEEQRAAHEKWMSRLMAATPHSSPSAVRTIIEEELGASPESLFARFDEVPMASASIGQVHRARLHDGREVVVKVQHHGVAEAVAADLANAGLIERTVNLTGVTSKFGTKRIYEQIRARFLEELDYDLEAERQRHFAELHRDHPRILVPAVIDDRSAKRVLTSELATGLTLDEAGAAPLADRVAWAETLWRFVFKGTLVGGVFNADPHPRNYYFAPDGRVWFLDFGCVQMLDAAHREYATQMHWAAISRDPAAFDDGVRGLLELRGGTYEDRALAYVRDAFKPLSESPFRIERPYVANLVQSFRDIGRHAVKEKDDEFVPIPDGMFFMNRLQFGFYSVLARLDCAVDFAEVERGFLPPP
ncbi:MAG: AarF/ABC1/UbiB kinase family protein [Deltaproteobacteria bacterium]|nr:AarF/ABC1/UbiB kinase family protein [Deltaproteobacteria bacterium]